MPQIWYPSSLGHWHARPLPETVRNLSLFDQLRGLADLADKEHSSVRLARDGLEWLNDTFYLVFETFEEGRLYEAGKVLSREKPILTLLEAAALLAAINHAQRLEACVIAEDASGARRVSPPARSRYAIRFYATHA